MDEMQSSGRFVFDEETTAFFASKSISVNPEAIRWPLSVLHLLPGDLIELQELGNVTFVVISRMFFIERQADQRTLVAQILLGLSNSARKLPKQPASVLTLAHPIQSPAAATADKG